MRASARKVRVVLDLIRGKPVEEAYRILSFHPRRSAEPVLKLLKSAVANAAQKDVRETGKLYVSRAFADGGFAFRKVEPRAMLRHGIMKRRTCHVTIEIEQVGDRKAAAAAKPGAEVKA
jgi:large subunit ribosomal protein L22